MLLSEVRGSWGPSTFLASCKADTRHTRLRGVDSTAWQMDTHFLINSLKKSANALEVAM